MDADYINSQSADSCFLFVVTVSQRLPRNTVVKGGGSQRQITFMGVDGTTDKQTTALSTPHECVLSLLNPPNIFLKAQINADLG